MLILALQSLCRDSQQCSSEADRLFYYHPLPFAPSLPPPAQKKLPSVGEADSLETLAGYLVLSKAETEQGFNAAEYGLSDEEAGRLAMQFARYDSNDDFVL